VSTIGRVAEIGTLLESLERQTHRDLEVIIVDQSRAGLGRALAALGTWSFPVTHLHTPDDKGLSRGRNVGWRQAKGQLLVFADDDCWYPPALFGAVSDLFRTSGADIVAGRAADESGRSINGRFEPTSTEIRRDNVWTTSIEWMLFFRRPVLQALGGFDEGIGVGASTPWQAAEGQDLVLRALEAGFTGLYDPALTGRHPELDIVRPDSAMCRKARAYGRGMGFVLRRHRFGLETLLTWIGRPLAATLIYGVTGRPRRMLYYLNVARGRLEGWLRHAPRPSAAR
jgi:glycosyltransferase involved in cell wall biosynthesis